MKSLVLVIAIVAGSLLPIMAEGAVVIRGFIMTMLFFSFLNVELRRKNFPPSILGVLLANLLIGLGAFFIARTISPVLGMAAFITGITPTATATPVIVSFLNRKAEYAIGAVILTNVVIALVLPLALPLVMGEDLQMSTAGMLISVGITILGPLVAALIVRRIGSVLRFLNKCRGISFYLWALCIFFACSRSSKFVLEQDVPLATLLQIAACSLVVCIISFSVGYLIGGKDHNLEASQSLGQKNTIFSMWVALNFISPLVALAPIFYLIFHNVYNSWQIHQLKRRSVKGEQ